ncbi:mitochondrial ribosomal protein MRP51 [Lasiosphaeria miniovina]|uniref:Mitochondrial ribosomal protein MRP51 n=1 Tax=Lasiosphaeria miniovina TaxID=1954250 RepID=A0AA39ZQF1_9PEZI|nr:mitochondrial ribosomal protein MRP51 [Lasiosphaeria miniovina]KAK0701693.1 mitochondrial ribosomal protein MRP51 [Lasiosphaeria miniovina]
MSAAARSVSPGGALLRSSRMFSLPAPIPDPPSTSALGDKYYNETATRAFPTHQVITTLNSSRQRGEWGLKRPLPLKPTTRTTYAMMRVKHVDTPEQITDYDQGTDHGLMLRKFQELNMAITMPLSRSTRELDGKFIRKPIFNDADDFTATVPARRVAEVDTRWKFTGPWLAGMSPGEFQKWVVKSVRPRRAEFQKFLKEQLALDMSEPLRNKAFEDGEEMPGPVTASTITDDQLTEYLRRLRHDKQELYHMVGTFLDLAPLKAPSIMELAAAGEDTSKVHLRDSNSPYAEMGPPVTHPSAGLSYLRTAYYMNNHPIYGPQKFHTPVESRVIRPRRTGLGLDAKLGVAGFIAQPPIGDTLSNNAKKKAEALDRLDPTLAGGAKLWIEPVRATVDATGRVVMDVVDVDLESLVVAKELLGELHVFGKPKKREPVKRVTAAQDIRNRFRQRVAPMPTMSSPEQYGTPAPAR